jgi:hypothetical protein
VCSVGHKLYYRQKPVAYEDMDFFTGKDEVDRDELENVPPEPRNFLESKFYFLRHMGGRHTLVAGKKRMLTPLLCRDLVCDSVSE